MKKISSHSFFIVFILFLYLLMACTESHPPDSLPQVILKTDLGDIILEIDTINAPVTASNFLKYVDDRIFNSAFFYRVVRIDNQPNNDIKIEVIQGGLGFDESPLSLSPIEHETTDKPGILHKDGVILYCLQKIQSPQSFPSLHWIMNIKLIWKTLLKKELYKPGIG